MDRDEGEGSGRELAAVGTASAEGRVAMRFYAPAPELVPYISAIYANEIDTAPGARLTDWLHPEWANLRFVEGTPTLASIGVGELAEMPPCILVGPTRHATQFSTGSIRSWGIGFLPLGWARFFSVAASTYADRWVDALADPIAAPLVGLRPILADAALSNEAKAAAINARLCALLDSSAKDDPMVAAIQAAIAAPDVHSVEDLAERVGASRSRLGRVIAQAFGFSPNILLRRQRLLRTLAAVMLDPSRRWTEALDPHYHDQAHFNHDFADFMGMTPRQYMAQPHPILAAAVRGRLAAAGAPMQLLHRSE